MYDGYDIVLSYDGAGSLTHRYLHGPAVDQVFADEDAAGEILWALADNQGTIRDIADYDPATDTTSVVNHRQFDAFGNITSETNAALDFLFAFTGRFWDEDTSLQNNLHRWYDPAVGRWLSEDPIGFAAGDPNLSRYVGNSPTNFIEPSGLDNDSLNAAMFGLSSDSRNYGRFDLKGVDKLVPHKSEKAESVPIAGRAALRGLDEALSGLDEVRFQAFECGGQRTFRLIRTDGGGVIPYRKTW